MTEHPVVAGEMTQGEHPYWEPLLSAIGEELTGTFMWMFEVRLEDGTEVHAYKHIHNRSYLHIAVDGRLFWFVAPSSYVEVKLTNVATM